MNTEARMKLRLWKTNPRAARLESICEGVVVFMWLIIVIGCIVRMFMH